MKIRVMIIDGVVESVLADQEAIESKVILEIVDYDRDMGDKELLNQQYETELKNIPYYIEHCEEKEEAVEHEEI